MDCSILTQLAGADLQRKAEIIQGFYESVAFHPSGIMYSMQRMDSHSVRPFTAADFAGKGAMSFDKWPRKPDGPWDYIHHENSISTSGMYLAAQSYRFQVTSDPAAMEQAEKAFRSLEIIYELGVKDGRPGWMGKPYSFRVSDQTSPDQYLDATWGLLAYHGIAAKPVQRRIEEMLVNFARYWRSINYVLGYFGHRWDVKQSTDAYNLILIMLNAVAHRFSGERSDLEEAQRFCKQGTWMRETSIDQAKQRALKGTREGLDRTFSAALKDGETICWEANILAKFTAVAIETILTVSPGLIDRDATPALELYWSTWKYGTGDDLLPYYWYAVHAKTDTWRPLPKTELLPRDQWMFDDPIMAYLSQVRWSNPLNRFMYTSVVAAKHCPAIAAKARDLALRFMGAIDSTRLHWFIDPDGGQLLPELSWMGEVLDSEMAPTFLATYWRGRLDGLW